MPKNKINKNKQIINFFIVIYKLKNNGDSTMNKIMKTTTLGLLISGAMFAVLESPSHAVDSSKFQELKQQFESGKVRVVPPSPDIKDFLDTSGTEIQSLQNQLNALLKERGYLVGTEYADKAKTFVLEAKKSINSLRAVQSLPGEIALARAQVPLLIELLKNEPVSDKFPFKCFDYKGKSVEGIVDRYRDQLVFRYGAGETEFYKFMEPKEDVGLIGSGQENPPKLTTQGKQETALLGPDGTVSCLSTEHEPKASSPTLKPSKQ